MVKILYITTGVPASGKSTILSLLNDGKTYYISKDQIRFMLNCYEYSKLDFRSIDEPIIKLTERFIFNQLIKTNVNIVLDGTYLTANSRAYYIDIAFIHGYKINFIVFNNIDQAIERNNNRERTVPHIDMMRMVKSFEHLTEYEQAIANKITFIEDAPKIEVIETNKVLEIYTCAGSKGRYVYIIKNFKFFDDLKNDEYNKYVTNLISITRALRHAYMLGYREVIIHNDYLNIDSLNTHKSTQNMIDTINGDGNNYILILKNEFVMWKNRMFGHVKVRFITPDKNKARGLLDGSKD